MIDFTVHDENTAPAASRKMLEGARSRLGFVSTLAGVMAESPELLEAYNAAFASFMRTSLPTLAKHTVLITASVVNACSYCVAAHSTMAHRARMHEVDLEALRDDRPMDDPGLEAVRLLTRAIVDNRGWLDDTRIDSFLESGYTRRHVLDVVLGVGVKTLSNYTNHVADTPLDPAWAAHAWTSRGQCVRMG
jgi:AhpD family alkylhydroperoxidase